MKINVSLIDKTFFFLEGLNISKGKGVEVVDLDNKSDSFYSSLASSIGFGILKSDMPHGDIVRLIRNEDLRESVAKRLKVDLSKKIEEKIIDVIETDVEIVRIETEEPITESIPEEVDEIFKNILKGTNKIVSNRLKDLDLSEEDRVGLLDMEKEGKNRVVIKRLLGE